MSKSNLQKNLERQKIEVQEIRDGTIIAIALIGPRGALYEIRKVVERLPFKVKGKQHFGLETSYLYYVDKENVPRDVYMAALETESRDQWCPDCMGGDDDGEENAAARPS